MEVDPPGSEASRVTTTAYYPSGDLKRRTKDFSDVSETYSYAADGRLANMSRDLAGSASDKNQDYDYDRNGNRTLDERGRHSYNARDQLVRWDPSKGPASARDMVSYKLNGSGAVTEKLDEAGPDTSYHYLADRLTEATTAGQTTLYAYNDFGSITCAHLQGQPCTAASSTEYRYDAFERRVGSSKETGTTYAYDGLDRRDTKATSGNVREFAYLGTSELLTREQDSGQTKRYDYDSSGRRQGQSVGGNYRSYGKDANGSVEALESASGAELGSYEYDPYGELTAEGQLSPAAQENPFRFEGFYYDSGIQTYDMQARTYAPEIGRFLNQDRYEAAGADLALQSDPLTQNRYAFAGGNPVSNVEWDGHRPQLECECPQQQKEVASQATEAIAETTTGGGTAGGTESGTGATVNAATGGSAPAPAAPAQPAQASNQRRDPAIENNAVLDTYCAGLPNADGTTTVLACGRPPDDHDNKVVDAFVRDAFGPVTGGCSVVPVYGTLCDLTSAAKSALDGDEIGVGLSLAGIFWEGASAAKAARNAGKNIDEGFSSADDAAEEGTAAAGGTAASRVAGSVDDVSRSAGMPYNTASPGLSRAGQSLSKHQYRGGPYPSAAGSPEAISRQAQDIVDHVLTSPASTFSTRQTGRFGEVVDIQIPGGAGVRYSEGGGFLHFLEPYR